jgi:hypothetical protein
MQHAMARIISHKIDSSFPWMENKGIAIVFDFDF